MLRHRNEVCMTDINLIFQSQFFLFKANNEQNSIFLWCIPRTHEKLTWLLDGIYVWKMRTGSNGL
jgi:hypothetical protein